MQTNNEGLQTNNEGSQTNNEESQTNNEGSQTMITVTWVENEHTTMIIFIAART